MILVEVWAASTLFLEPGKATFDERALYDGAAREAAHPPRNCANGTGRPLRRSSSLTPPRPTPAPPHPPHPPTPPPPRPPPPAPPDPRPPPHAPPPAHAQPGEVGHHTGPAIPMIDDHDIAVA